MGQLTHFAYGILAYFICPPSHFMETFGTNGPRSRETAMGVNIRALQMVWIMLAAVVSQPAMAQSPSLQGLAGIQVEYKEPSSPAHKPIYDRLKRRAVLEQYKEFMSPLRFKRSLQVALQGCGGVINAFHNGGRISYCYELIAETQRRIAETDVLPGFRREDAIVGGFVSTLLHETGHAIFHLYDIPIFGREEDAADAVAAYVSLQFGATTARRILTGTAFVWRASEVMRQKRISSRTFQDYADEHGTDAQRFFNTLCIALGSDQVENTKVFSDFVALLPETRRAHCPREYLHVKNSFAKFVLPHVDLELLKKVRATEWLRNDDGSEIDPPRPLGPAGGPGSGGPSHPKLGRPPGAN
jgi:Putative metallopeptidase